MFKFKLYAKHNFFSRIEFAEFFIDKCNQSDEFFQNVLWTDEAYFYMEGNVSNRNFVIWPARSLDLYPADFWLWSMLKQRVYRRKPGNLAELKILITEEISKITVDEQLNATSNILDRLHLIIANGGRHIEHVL